MLLKEKLNKIKELIRIHPEFSEEWSLRGTNIVVTPETEIEIDNSELSELDKKLYADFISSVLNLIPDLITYIDNLEVDNHSLQSELRHFANSEKKGRIRGIREVAKIIEETKPISSTSRDILQGLILKVADALEVILNENQKDIKEIQFDEES